MERRPFLPTARQTNFLLIVGFLSVGYAMYLRYLAIEQPMVGLACDGGLATWLCTTRRTVTALFTHSVFGWTALAIATLHLIRPSIVLLAAGIAVAGFGVVLYNAGLSALAIAILILAFARPQAAEDLP
jgi:hypothetical protein